MPTLTDHVRAMARNNAWSNHRLYEACVRLAPTELAARRTNFFPSILLTLNHILLVDWYYLDALEGGGLGPRVFDIPVPYADAGLLREAQGEADTRLMALCDGLAEPDLDRTVVLVRQGDRRYPETAHAVLSHLFVHQIHHRGQVHAMLAGTGLAPPQLDEFFLDQDAPLRAGDLRDLGWRTRS